MSNHYLSVNPVFLVRPFIQPARRLCVVFALAAIAAGGDAAAQTASPASSVGLYGIPQRGQLQQFEVSGTEVVAVDENGRGSLRQISGGVGQALRLARRPATGSTSSHLVLYPVGKERNEANRRIMRNRMVVELVEGASAEALATELGARSFRLIPGSPARVVLTFANAAETIGKVLAAQSATGAASAEPLLARTMFKRALPGEEDPLDGDPAWHLKNLGIGGTQAGTDINVEEAWDSLGVTGAGVTIGIVDDGFETDHPDLDGKFVDGYSWNDEDSTSIIPVLPTDDHGTAMAGLAAAIGDNPGDGTIVGVAYGADLVGLRLTGAPFDDLDEEQALGGRNGDFAPSSTVDISCNLWGPSDLVTDLDGPKENVQKAIQKGVADGRGGNGIIYVWAGGNGAEVNDNSNYDGYANMPETIAVGAVEDGGDRAIYSERGANLVVSAPSGGGTNDLTTTNYRGVPEGDDPPVYPNPDTRSDISGTSASAALVSGVVAMMLEANPDLGWRDVQEILMKTAAKFPVTSTVTTKNGTMLSDTAVDFDVALGNGGVYYLVPDDGENAGMPTRVASWDLNDLTTIDDFGSDATWTGAYTIQSLVAPSDAEWVLNAAGYHFNHNFGAGLVNASAAVKEATARGANVLDARDPSLFTYKYVGEAEKTPGTECDYLVEIDLSGEDNYRVEHVQVNPLVVHERRSDLEIMLISPNGTQSVLAESHTNGTGQGIDFWPFMTVRNWGEGSQGIWLLRVRDTVPGVEGILNSFQFIVHGVADPNAPVDSDPVVVSSKVIDGAVNTSLSYILEVIRALSVAIDANDLPPGLTYTPDPAAPETGGTISGTPTETGLFTVPVTLTGVDGPSVDYLSFVIEPITNSLGDAALHPDELAPGSPQRESVSSGTANWLFEFINTNGDTDAVGSALDLDDRQYSQFGFQGITVPTESVVAFDWHVDSESLPADLDAEPPLEPRHDRLWFTVGPMAAPAGSPGAPPLSWNAFIDGTARPWRSVAAIMAPETSVSWRYTKDDEGSAGVDRGFVNNVKFWPLQDYLDMISDNVEANFPLIHDSRTLWIPVDDPAAAGGNAVESSGIGDGQEVTLEARLPGPGTLTFDWRVSSEQDEDFLSLILNGLVYDSISGGIGSYQTLSVPLPDSPDGLPNRVIWEFKKNISGDGGTDDRARLDNFMYSYSYLAWLDQNFDPALIPDPPADPLLDPVVGLDADPDGDGFTNEEEFAWGTDPNVPDVSPRLPKAGSGANPGSVVIEFTVDTALEGLTFTLRESPDLSPGSWTDVPAGSITALAPNGSLQTYQYVIDPALGSNFFQVLVEYAAP